MVLSNIQESTLVIFPFSRGKTVSGSWVRKQKMRGRRQILNSYIAIQFSIRIIIIMRKQIIEILSDHEEQEMIKDKQTVLLQKQLEDEASLLKSPTSLMIAVNAQFIPGTLEEKRKVLIERIKKMYIQKLKFDASKDFFCLKRQPNYNEPNSQLMLNEILIYGTEFWPTRQIKKDAGKLGINVEPIKIDDSHTKLKFEDCSTAKRWLEFYIKDKNVLTTKMQEQMDQNYEQGLRSESLLKIKGWFQLEPYLYQGFSRSRQARFCTNSQQNIQQLQDDVKTTSFAKFKQYIASQLMKTQQAKIAYAKAQQRNFHNYRYSNKEKRYHNGYNNGNNGRQYEYDRYRHQRDRDYRDHRGCNELNYQRSRYKQDYKNNRKERNNYNSSKHNKSFENKNPAHLQTHPSKAPTQVRDDLSSYSFLFDGNDNACDVSIANALKQMTLQEGDLDMSIDLTPATSSNLQTNHVDQDMSIDMIPKQQEPAESKDRERAEDGMKKKGWQKVINPVTAKEQDKKKQSKFNYDDYLKYVEDCMKLQETQRVRPYKANNV